MSDTPPTWAIVELMGHVKIAGRLSEEEKFGAKMGRLDIPMGQGCSSVSAGWCPVCGDCTCKDGGDKNDEACPLHSASSHHGEQQGERFVTQFFGGASVYRITVCTEEVARTVAKGNKPQPVSPWDFPRQLPAAEHPPTGDDPGDDDYDPDEDMEDEYEPRHADPAF